MMDLTTDGLALINNTFGILASIGVIASWPIVRRFLVIETFKGRRGKRRRLLRRYLRARTIAQRPSVGLADMATIGCLMVLTGFLLLLMAVSLSVRRAEGPPPTLEDASSMFLLFILLGMTFISACSVATEIKNAPKTARRLKAGLRKPKYRPLSAGDGSCPCNREAA